MFKMFSKSLIVALVVAMFMPFFDAQASSGYFTYRSTEIGSGTRQTGQWEYEITNEKYDFSTSESVFALTRIFNITNVDTFQFKYHIRGGASRDMLSPMYRPNGNWWAEIWYWDEFGRLPAGNYDLQALISVDGGAFRHLESKQFRVSGSGYYGGDDSYYDYNDYYGNDYCDSISYDFEWLKTGKNVRDLGSYVKELVEPSRNFTSSENVYVMVKNTHIRGVDTFRIKFDVYLNGDRHYRSNEVPTLNPNCELWAYNYSWANLGRLPNGNHEIRTYIKFNNGDYRLLDTEQVRIGATSPTTSSSYRQDPSRDYNYSYSWTQTDSRVNFHGDYRYSVDKSKDVFSSRDEMKVLTRLSDIENIRTFKIRHELHKNGSYERKIESAERRPHYKYWEYNYTQSNFGRLSSGSYEIKTYISIDGDAWRQLDSKRISVSGNSYTSDDYDFDYTRVDTDFDYVNQRYY